MAKKKKIDSSVLYVNEEGSILGLSSSYEYEVEVFMLQGNQYSLYNILNVNKKELLTKTTIYEKEGDDRLKIQFFNLKAAPLSYLEKHKYIKYVTDNV